MEYMSFVGCLWMCHFLGMLQEENTKNIYRNAKQEKEETWSENFCSYLRFAVVMLAVKGDIVG